MSLKTARPDSDVNMRQPVRQVQLPLEPIPEFVHLNSVLSVEKGSRHRFRGIGTHTLTDSKAEAIVHWRVQSPFSRI
jgi:hypothetical protein